MNRTIPSLLVLLAALAAPASLVAQDSYTFTVGLLGGIGGSFDGQGDEDFDHRALEATVAMLTNDRTLAVVRAGKLDFDDDLNFEGWVDAELMFVTIAGEYRFRQPTYDFGMYLGLGGYELAGHELGVGDQDERALGLAFGLTGDFDVTRHFSLVAEFSVHYVFLDRADLYGFALGGAAVHF